MLAKMTLVSADCFRPAMMAMLTVNTSPKMRFRHVAFFVFHPHRRSPEWR